MTPDDYMRLTQDADRFVWETTEYRRDPPNQDIWGNVTWENGKAVGDCEEWADRAMDKCLSLGIAAPSICAALCDTQARVGRYDHAVCLVMTLSGLMTCGDSYDRFGPRPVLSARYWMHSYMRLDHPGVWREWKGLNNA